MAVMEKKAREKSNTRVQWEKVKQGSAQEKFDWLVSYFGVPALLVLFFAGIIIAWIIVATRSTKPVLINGILLDTRIEAEEETNLRDKLVEVLGRSGEYDLGISGSLFNTAGTEEQLNQMLVIQTRAGAGDLDLLGAVNSLSGFVDPEEPDASYLCPLNYVLPDDLLSALEKEGRVTVLSTSEGDFPYFVNIGGSLLAELLNIRVEKYEIGIVANTFPHKEELIALFQLALD